MSVKRRALWWLLNGERGDSSETICAVMLRLVDEEKKERSHSHHPAPRHSGHSRYGHPHDPWDFRRCIILLELIPEWRPKLHRVARAFPTWNNLVAHWDELEALYAEEQFHEKMPKLYNRIQELTGLSEGMLFRPTPSARS
jgi:hypothetical protein